jgi:hypothetical protein
MTRRSCDLRGAFAGVLSLLLSVAVLSYAQSSRDLIIKEERTVEGQGQLLWTAEVQTRPGAEEVYFLFDPIMGLRDVDFHLITDEGWAQMKSPSADAVAKLLVTPNTKMDDIRKVLETVAAKGGYRFIEVTVRNP